MSQADCMMLLSQTYERSVHDFMTMPAGELYLDRGCSNLQKGCANARCRAIIHSTNTVCAKDTSIYSVTSVVGNEIM